MDLCIDGRLKKKINILVSSDVNIDVSNIIAILKKDYFVDFDICEKNEIYERLSHKNYHILIIESKFDIFQNEIVKDLRSKKVQIPYIVITKGEGDSPDEVNILFGKPYYELSDNFRNLYYCVSDGINLHETLEKLEISEKNVVDYQKGLVMANKILLEMATITNNLLQKEPQESEISLILEKFGKLTNVSKIYVFEKHEINTDCYYDMAYKWIGEEHGCRLGDIMDKELIYTPCTGYDGKKTNLYQILEDKKPFSGITRNFDTNTPFRTFLEEEKILSIICIPIESPDGTVWGFIGFDDCVYERAWTEIETSALTAVASLVGTLIFKVRRNSRIHEILDSAVNDQIIFGVQLENIKKRLSQYGI
jgi:GAF domain-containing protein